MKCSFCGNELEAGSNFCPKCGTILSVEENNEADDTTYHEPADLYANSKPEEEQYEAPEYVSSVLEDEPIYDKPLESEDDDDDPFKEMHPEEYEESAEKNDYEEDDDDNGEDMLVKDTKGKKGVAVISVLVILLAIVVVGGVYAVKNNISLPFISNTKDANAFVSDSSSDPDSDSEPSSTDEDTTDEDATDEDTTDEDAAEEEPSDEDTTEEKSAKPSTTEKKSENIVSKPSQTTQTTAAPTTTLPTTTVPKTTAPKTTVPTTTAPATTSPTATTAPATTAKPTAPQTTTAANQLKKPAKTISKFTVYATEDGVSLRYTPSASSSRILYLSIGADLVVSGEENGFYYVYSNRYSVYGWVSKAYTASKRPTAKTEQKVSGVVTPDVKGSGKTMYVNTTAGLRLRKGPGTNYDVIRMISNGYPVVVKGSSSAVSGWVYVTDTTHGVSGWVSSAYLK